MDGLTPSLLPARFRSVALLVALAGWVEMIVLGVVFAGGRGPDPFDAGVMKAVFHTVGHHGTFGAILLVPCDPIVVYLVIAVLLGYGLLRRRWDVAILSVAGPGLAIAFVELVGKPLFDRRYHGGLSFPSGHTTSAVAALTVALLVLLGLVRTRLARIVLGLVWLLLVLSLMTGLVAMDYHYPTDTIGGLGLAIGVVLPLAALVSRWRGAPVRPSRAASPNPGTVRQGEISP